MRILGIDPGYERLGIALLEKEKGGIKEQVLHSECFKTPAGDNFENRLLLLGKKIRKVIKKFKPEVLAIETLFMNTNQKTAIKVAEARGVVIYEAAEAGLAVREISPLAVKMATTGYGRAGKAEVTKMVKMLVNIEETIKSDDELDAIAIALSAFADIKKYHD